MFATENSDTSTVKYREAFVLVLRLALFLLQSVRVQQELEVTVIQEVHIHAYGLLRIWNKHVSNG